LEGNQLGEPIRPTLMATTKANYKLTCLVNHYDGWISAFVL
jgi:hypothetical protein